MVSCMIQACAVRRIDLVFVETRLVPATDGFIYKEAGPDYKPIFSSECHVKVKDGCRRVEQCHSEVTSWFAIILLSEAWNGMKFESTSWQSLR